MQETSVRSLGWEDPLEKGMTTHSSILAWKISWTEAPGGLQSMILQRVGQDWATDTQRPSQAYSSSNPRANLNWQKHSLILGKVVGRRRRGQQRMKWLDDIIDSMDMSMSKLREMVKDREAWWATVHGVTESQTWLSDWRTTTIRVISLFLPGIDLVLDLWCNSGQCIWSMYKGESARGILGMFSLLLRKRQRKRRPRSPFGFFLPVWIWLLEWLWHPATAIQSLEDSTAESHCREAELESWYRDAMSLLFWCIFIIQDDGFAVKTNLCQEVVFQTNQASGPGNSISSTMPSYIHSLFKALFLEFQCHCSDWQSTGDPWTHKPSLSGLHLHPLLPSTTLRGLRRLLLFSH